MYRHVHARTSACSSIVGGDGLQPNLFAQELLHCFSSMANICCSIETEPRTLNEGQLNHAREAAVDIVHKLETKEASNVFTEGLRAIVPIKEKEEQIVEKGDELQSTPDDHQCRERERERAQIMGKPCQCSCIIPTIMESPDQDKFREPLSAPF